MREEIVSAVPKSIKVGGWEFSLFWVKFAGRRAITAVKGNQHYNTILKADAEMGQLILGVIPRLLSQLEVDTLPSINGFVQVVEDKELKDLNYQNLIIHNQCETKQLNIVDDTPFLPGDFERVAKTIEFIDEKRKNGGNVYVHCRVGIGRSPSVVLSYLTSICKMKAEEAFELVQKARPQIHPSPEQFLSVIEFNLDYQIKKHQSTQEGWNFVSGSRLSGSDTRSWGFQGGARLPLGASGGLPAAPAVNPGRSSRLSGNSWNSVIQAFNDFHEGSLAEFRRALLQGQTKDFKIKGHKNGFEYVSANLASLVKAAQYILEYKDDFSEDEAREFHQKLLGMFKMLNEIYAAYYHLIKKDDAKENQEFEAHNKTLNSAIQMNKPISAFEITASKEALKKIAATCIKEFTRFQPNNQKNAEIVQKWKNKFSSVEKDLGSANTFSEIKLIQKKMLDALSDPKDPVFENRFVAFLYKIKRWIQDIFNIGHSRQNLNECIRIKVEEFPFRSVTGQFDCLNNIFSEQAKHNKARHQAQKDNPQEHDNNQPLESDDTQGENTSDCSDIGSNHGR